VDIHEGGTKILYPINGSLLALDPQARFLAERVYDESVPDPNGSPKRYEISHLYLLDLNTAHAQRWEIPKGAQQFLPAGEECQVSDYKDSVGWEPQSGSQFLFMVKCGQRLKRSTKQFVFLVDRDLNRVQVLWQGIKAQYITALWEPYGQRVLLQISDMDANGVPQGGKTVLLDKQGQVIRTWQDFPSPTFRIIGWGMP